jgi:hypothetical protein
MEINIDILQSRKKIMMLPEKEIACPYCGENFTVFIDDSVDDQSYIEDCQVCCRPINFRVIVAIDGEISLSVRSDDE